MIFLNFLNIVCYNLFQLQKSIAFIYCPLGYPLMVAKKLTEKDVEDIKKLIKNGKSTKECAKLYNVHQSTIQRRCKTALKAKSHPLETKLKVIKKVKEGYSKAEAGLMYGVSPHTVVEWTKGIKSYRYAGDHIIRKHGIELLNRLLSDGYLISDFVVSTVRGLQKHFPMILSARFKGKTFFYLEGREEDALEGYFREKPDRVINYSAIEELSYLLDIKVSRKSQRKLLDKYKGKHKMYWRSRRLVQHSLDDWIHYDPFRS
jgi:transposase